MKTRAAQTRETRAACEMRAHAHGETIAVSAARERGPGPGMKMGAARMRECMPSGRALATLVACDGVRGTREEERG